MQHSHRRASKSSSSMPTTQLRPAASCARQAGVASAAAAPVQQLHSAQHRMLLPQIKSIPPAAANAPVTVSLHPSGNGSVTLELTTTRANLQPAMTASFLPSHSAHNTGLASGLTQTSGPHVAGASGMQASLQPGSKLLHMGAMPEEAVAVLLDTQGPPLLDTQGPSLGYTQVHM